MTKLTTHVLDIYSGKPGAGIKVELYYFNNNKREMKKTLTLNECPPAWSDSAGQNW